MRVVVLLAACASADVEVSAIQDRGSLVQGALQALNGSYVGCLRRSGSFSVAVDGYAGALAHPALSLVQGDTCTLTLSGIVISGVTYSASSAVAMGAVGTYGSYQARATKSGAVITVLVSNDPQASATTRTAQYEVTTYTASAAGVPVPDYVADLSALQIKLNGDAAVATVSGSIALSGTVGQKYVLVQGAVSDVHAAFTAGSQIAVPASVSAASLSLTSLPATRTIIVQNLTSYLVFVLGFTAGTTKVRVVNYSASTFNNGTVIGALRVGAGEWIRNVHVMASAQATDITIDTVNATVLKNNAYAYVPGPIAPTAGWNNITYTSGGSRTQPMSIQLELVSSTSHIGLVKTGSASLSNGTLLDQQPIYVPTATGEVFNNAAIQIPAGAAAATTVEIVESCDSGATTHSLSPTYVMSIASAGTASTVLGTSQTLTSGCFYYAKYNTGGTRSYQLNFQADVD